MKRPWYRLLICICPLLAISCDPGSRIEYSITNKTSFPVSIRYQFTSDTLETDTIIQPNNTLVARKENRLGFATNIDERLDSIPLFLLLLKQKDKPVNKNFQDKKYWRFKIINDHYSSYQLVVDNTIFARQ